MNYLSLFLLSLMLFGCAGKMLVAESERLTEVKIKYADMISYSDKKSAIDYSSLKLGYEYTTQGIDENGQIKPTERMPLRLTNIKDNGYYFSFLNDDGTIKRKDAILWKDGYQYYKFGDSDRYVPFHKSQFCRYVVGKCKFESPTRGEEYVVSEFKDGVWTRKYDRRIEVDVFDIYGFPLYHLNKNKITSFERIRVD